MISSRTKSALEAAKRRGVKPVNNPEASSGALMYEKTGIERSKLRGIQPARPGLINMNDLLRDRTGKIIGWIDWEWLRDGTGKLVARYDTWDDRTRDRTGRVAGNGD
jgi:hypothetical protein